MGKMLIGQFNNNLDEQKRISIPSKYSIIDEKVILVKGFEKCIYLFLNAEFETLLARINDLSITHKQNREFARLFLSGAYEVSVDSKGRIAIPQELVSYANLSKTCSFVGTGSRLEIWDYDEWQKYYNEEEKTLEKISEEVDL